MYLAQRYYLILSFMFLAPCGTVESEEQNFDQTWGLPDMTAYSRLAFIYQLPKFASSYEVTESGLDFLPNWLEYDDVTKELVGVPRQDDVGKQFFIEVKSSISNTVDIFKIEVEDNKKLELLNINVDDKSIDSNNFLDKSNQDNYVDIRHHHQHIIHCKKNKPVTTALIILKVNYDQLQNLTPQSRVKILKNFSTLYNFPMQSVQLVELKECDEMNHFEKTALVAGPGDANPNFKLGTRNKHLESLENGHNIVLKWVVGCGNVQKRHLTALQRVENEARDGQLKEFLGLGVIGWFVTNKKPHDQQKRKRYIYKNLATATPTLDIQPPIVTNPASKSVILPSITTTTKKPSKIPGHSKGPKVRKTTAAVRVVTDPTDIEDEDEDDVHYTPSFPYEFKTVKSFPSFKMYVGEVYNLKVTPDFFTSNYKSLELLAPNGLTLPNSSWIKLNTTRQKRSHPYIYGIPLSIHEGLQDYLLKAIDKYGNEAKLYLKFQVVKLPVEYIIYEMNVLLSDYNYAEYCHDVDMRMNLVQKIASVFGDLDPTDVLMTKVEEGSIDYYWTNKTMTSIMQSNQKDRKMCYELEKLFDKFINKSNNRLSGGFIQKISPSKISYAEAVTLGECEGYVLSRKPPSIEGIKVTPKMKVTLAAIPTTTQRLKTYSDSDDTFKYSVFDNNLPESKVDESQVDLEKDAEASRTDEELLKQIIIPTLIVAALVLLALLIGCVAYRKKNKQNEKQKSLDTTELVKKGAPVIFAHELDDHPPVTPSTRPLITAGEKSPRPPNYHQRMTMSTGGGGGGGSGYGGF